MKQIPTVQAPEQKAVVSVPAPIPAAPAWLAMANYEVIGSLVAAVAGTWFFVRKRYHQDGNEITKAKAEASLVETLIKQAEVYKEDARRAWGYRTQDAEIIARQQAQIESMARTIRVMREILGEVAPDKAKLLNGLHDIPEPLNLDYRNEGK